MKKSLFIFIISLIIFLLILTPLSKKISAQVEEDTYFTAPHLTVNSKMTINDLLTTNGLQIKKDDLFGLINVEDLSDQREYYLPDSSGEICLSSGNCDSSSAAGEVNNLAKFSSQGLTDSSITDLATTNSLTISESGNLGIGKEPETALDVEGDITASEDICAEMGEVCLSNLQEDLEASKEGTLSSIKANGEGTTGAIPIWRDDGLGDSIMTEKDGNVGIGSTPRARLDVSGDLRVLGFRFPVSAKEGYGLLSDDNGVGTWEPVLTPEDSRADIAERFPIDKDDKTPQAGELVYISKNGTFKRTNEAYQSTLAGVVSTEPALTLAADMSSSIKVALTGSAPLKTSLLGGEISPGDLLTSSSIPGVAKKATSSGRVIGFALESLSRDDFKDCQNKCIRKIKVFINPHHKRVEKVKDNLKLKDQETGKVYCIQIKNNELIKSRCDD